MEKQPGRKALIVLSDGVDMGSQESLDVAIESAQRANTIVYSILFKDDDAYGNGGGFGRTGISIPGMGGPGMGRGGIGARWAAHTLKSMPTARKFWNESPAKPVDACF